MTDRKSSELLDRYLVQREALRRLFAARGGPEFAEDLVQELYFKVTAQDPDEEVLNPDAYLYRLAMNLMIDKARQRQRIGQRDAAWRGLHHVTVGDEDVSDAPDSERVLLARRRLERLNAILERLPAAEQQAFRLVKFEALSHAQAGAQMGLAPRAIERLIAKAMKSMLPELEP